MPQTFNSLKKSAEGMSDDFLVESVNHILLSDYYVESDYTPMITNILEQYEKRGLSEKQRQALEWHYIFNANCLEMDE